MFKLCMCICLLSTALAAPKQKFAKYSPGGRILGGENVTIADFPYMLSITADQDHTCGATLISETWAVTAAQCMYGFYPALLGVRGNSSSLEGGATFEIKNITVHPNFEFWSAESDIALLELAAPLNCTYCKPLALGAAAPVVGKNVTLVGWGIYDTDYEYDNNYEISGTLQKAQLPVVDVDACNETYVDLGLGPVSGNMFCAGLVGKGDVGSCYGDSGGPVLQDGKLIGIVSWGYGCGKPEYPDVYTLVPKFLDWIKNITGVSP